MFCTFAFAIVSWGINQKAPQMNTDEGLQNAWMASGAEAPFASLAFGGAEAPPFRIDWADDFL
jgi:hypothetical protein